jgi:hypothetical protein
MNPPYPTFSTYPDTEHSQSNAQLLLLEHQLRAAEDKLHQRQ